ncbi:unnamed protein product, partial [Darwinula stevensoni]
MDTSKLKEDGIIPDMVSTVPPEVVQVKYPSGAEVKMGNVLTPTQVKDVPQVSWNADPHSYYTLAMTDPDAPSRQNPKFREWQHWMVVNIPGNDVSKGKVMSEYVGSGPPQGTGLHRYVFFVYKQPGTISPKEKHLTNTSGDGRASFKIAD